MKWTLLRYLHLELCRATLNTRRLFSLLRGRPLRGEEITLDAGRGDAAREEGKGGEDSLEFAFVVHEIVHGDGHETEEELHEDEDQREKRHETDQRRVPLAVEDFLFALRGRGDSHLVVAAEVGGKGESGVEEEEDAGRILEQKLHPQ